MLASWLIVFREVLESALIVSIVLAAARGVPGRNQWVATGIGAGILGAGLVAAFAGAIASIAEGMGMELFNALILGLAVLMLGWHTVWMASHGRAMAKEADALGHAVHDGAKPLYALAVAVGVAVLREGSETVLFLYGIIASGSESLLSIGIGGALGVATGSAAGAALYLGLLRIPVRHIFSVSSWMILLLCAGLAAQCAGFLVQADQIPALGNAVWDSSALLTESSLPGKVLHTLIGYISRPSGVQVLAYLATIVTITALRRWAMLRPHKPALATTA